MSLDLHEVDCVEYATSSRMEPWEEYELNLHLKPGRTVHFDGEDGGWQEIARGQVDASYASLKVALPQDLSNSRETLPSQFREELDAFVRAAGFGEFEVAHDVRPYSDEESGRSWISHVFSIMLANAERRERSRLMRDLLDFLGEHDDERVRKGVTVRVR